MNRLINFVVPSPPSYLAVYEKVIYSMINPIKPYLPGCQVSDQSVHEAINIHFFTEPTYFKKMLDPGSINVHMPHSMGDKQLRDANRVECYDYTCVSGPLWAEKMRKGNLPESKILIIGYPKLDPLFQSKGTRKRDPNFIRVLYAPTHVGSGKCSSYSEFMKYLDQFPTGFQVSVSPHPYHKKGNFPTLEEFKDTDVLISDGSSVIYEAMSLGIPVVFPDWIVKDAILKNWPDTFTAQIYRDGIGYHAGRFEDMPELIREAAEKKISKSDQQFIDGILPPRLRGNSGREAAKILQGLAELRQNDGRTAVQPTAFSAFSNILQ